MTTDLATLRDRLAAFRERMSGLLFRAGHHAQCPGCGVPIWWVAHRSGHVVAYTVTGERHCPQCKNPEPLRRESLRRQERQG